MKREYRLITKYKGKEDHDICGTFFTCLCLITSKMWGNFEVVNIKRLDFYE